ncbi:exported hypothetical protein [Frankia sp. AiPs1]
MRSMARRARSRSVWSARRAGSTSWSPTTAPACRRTFSSSTHLGWGCRSCASWCWGRCMARSGSRRVRNPGRRRSCPSHFLKVECLGPRAVGIPWMCPSSVVGVAMAHAFARERLLWRSSRARSHEGARDAAGPMREPRSLRSRPGSAA